MGLEKGERNVTSDQLSRRMAFLRQVPLFADLSDRDLASCIQDLSPRRYARAEVIFHQGDTSRDLYIVVEGKVRVFRTCPSGEETSIQIFGPHDVIGEFAVVDRQPRSAAARAIGPCVLLVMAGDVFLRHMRALPDLALGMARLLVRKARWTASYAEAIAQYDAAGRLLHILLLYNEQFGEAVEAGKRYVLDLGLTQADLASLVGARREWVNRILQGWRDRELIEYDGGTITILDLPAVERERDSRIEAIHQEMEW
jgi:CRP/FNR family cyclic AMP-dependent transcriptional regulator